jgi:hypothetical protein
MSDSDENDEPRTPTAEIYQQMLVRADKVMRLTLGALIEYFQGPQYANMSDEQIDKIFSIVITTWAAMLPPPVGPMWDELIISLTVEHTRTKEFLDEVSQSLGWGPLYGDPDEDPEEPTPGS